jgi:phytoene dehydrogenase-like protein
MGGDVDRTFFVEIAPFTEDFLRAFEEYAYGIPNSRIPVIGVASLADPTRAPEGKHTMYLYHYEPYNLRNGGPGKWDTIKEEVADAILETVRNFTTNMKDENILGRYIISPVDIERINPAMVSGDVMHIGAFLSQYFSNRPLPGWGNYRTPVKKLYMCGGSTHPGAGVSGGGRTAVQVVMEDLGIDFKKVITK